MRLDRRIAARLHGVDRALAFLGLSFLVGGVAMGYVAGFRSLTEFVLVASVPALTSLLMLVICAFWPGVASEDGFHEPQNVTLPVLYGVALWTIGLLSITPSAAIIAVRPELTPLTLWQNLWLVIGLAGFSVAVLTVSARRQTGR